MEPEHAAPEQKPSTTDARPEQAGGDRPQPSPPDLQDRWLRAVADLDNARKQYARELARVRSDERARVAGRWLPILDNLELALSHAEADPASIISGVEAVRELAVAALAELGFARHDENEQVGEQFDPGRHEVVSVVADPDAKPGTILRVVRPGYGDGADQLRPAAVVVAGPTEDR